MRQTPITISVEDEAPLRAAIARGDLAAVRAMAEGPWPISFADLDRALAWMRLHPGDPVSGRLGSIRDDEAYGPIAARLVGLGEERLMWSMRGAAPDALITHSAPSQLRRSVRRGLLVPESVGLHSLDLTRRRVQANCDLSVLIDHRRRLREAGWKADYFLICDPRSISREFVDLRLGLRTTGVTPEGRQIGTEVSCVLKPTRHAASVRDLIERAIGAVMVAHGEPIHIPPTHVLGLDGAPSSQSADMDGELDGARAVRHVAELCGDAGPCYHRDAAWSANDTRDAVVLGCPRCGRARLACVPAHRLPEGEGLLEEIRSAPRTYLRAEGRYRAATGRVSWSDLEIHRMGVDRRRGAIEQIRSEDGISSLRIQDHLRASSAGLEAVPETWRMRL